MAESSPTLICTAMLQSLDAGSVAALPEGLRVELEGVEDAGGVRFLQEMAAQLRVRAVDAGCPSSRSLSGLGSLAAPDRDRCRTAADACERAACTRLMCLGAPGDNRPCGCDVALRQPDQCGFAWSLDFLWTLFHRDRVKSVMLRSSGGWRPRSWTPRRGSSTRR